MARRAMVTRKMKVTKCVLMMVDVTTGEVYNDVTKITRAPKDKEKLLSIIKKKLESDIVKVVDIVDRTDMIEHRAVDEQQYYDESILITEEEANEMEEN